MATDLFTLGVLALVMIGGWLIDHLGRSEKSRLGHGIKVHSEKTVDAARGAPRR